MNVDLSGFNLGGIIPNIEQARITYLAATGTMVDVASRAFERGELTDGGKIAYKEDYEVYGYKPPAPRAVTGKGKPNAEGKSRKIKGGYYKTYLAFKQQQGRANTFFELTGQLRRGYFGGARPTPIEVSPTTVEVRLTGSNAQKFVGLTETKGAFLALNENEKQGYLQRLLEGYQSILK